MDKNPVHEKWRSFAWFDDEDMTHQCEISPLSWWIKFQSKEKSSPQIKYQRCEVRDGSIDVPNRIYRRQWWLSSSNRDVLEQIELFQWGDSSVGDELNTSRRQRVRFVCRLFLFSCRGLIVRLVSWFKPDPKENLPTQPYRGTSVLGCWVGLVNLLFCTNSLGPAMVGLRRGRE